jgi:hypothetical protein
MVVHTDPLQQPVGQFVASHPHTPSLQLLGAVHVEQVPPPAPHAAFVLPGSHVLPLQHVLHDVLSQTHMPPEQCCPVEQAGWPPHVHLPVDSEHPSPVVPQLWHVLPSLLHAAPVGGDVQTEPVQQPSGHDVELQTHCPPTHVCPVPHAGPAPQLHTPDAEQVLAVFTLHARHAPPSVPQLANPGVTHSLLLLQQPLGHDVELHVQTPPRQIWPEAHTPDDPQLHCPFAVHVLAVAELHATHATASVPHVPKDGVSQSAPEQHPLAQFAVVHPVHEPPTQFWFPGHALHVEPPEPHWEFDSLVTQATGLVVQQPVGHEVLLHWHVPPTHSRPAAHAAPPPQVHAPVPEQPSAFEPHAMQVEPDAPHAAAVVGETHAWLAEQHPLGHDVELHTHVPPLHSCPGAHTPPAPQEHVPSVQPSAVGTVPEVQSRQTEP